MILLFRSNNTTLNLSISWFGDQMNLPENLKRFQVTHFSFNIEVILSKGLVWSKMAGDNKGKRYIKQNINP